MDKTELETDIETQIETQIETETETGTEIVNEKQILQTRYKSNPFVKDMIIKTKNQTVTLSTLGKDNNVPSGIIGLACPPHEESKPFLLNIS